MCVAATVREVCNRSSEVRELWGVKGVQCDESCAVKLSEGKCV